MREGRPSLMVRLFREKAVRRTLLHSHSTLLCSGYALLGLSFYTGNLLTVLIPHAFPISSADSILLRCQATRPVMRKSGVMWQVTRRVTTSVWCRRCGTCSVRSSGGSTGAARRSRAHRWTVCVAATRRTRYPPPPRPGTAWWTWWPSPTVTAPTAGPPSAATRW